VDRSRSADETQAQSEYPRSLEVRCSHQPDKPILIQSHLKKGIVDQHVER
jgi:hypothetical protein